MFLNYLIYIFFTINEFVNSILLSLFNNYMFEGITIISIIWLASGSKATKILDVGSKLIGSAAGSTFLYNYWVKGSSSSSNEDNDKKDKKDKKDNKENKNITYNQVTNGK